MLRSSYAQLANHLHPYAAAYAWCLEEGLDFRTPGFSRYAALLREQGGSAQGPVADTVAWRLTRLAQRSGLIGPTLVAPPTGPVTMLPPSATEPAGVRDALERRPPRVFLQGWRFRNPVGLERHRAAVLDRFSPAPAVQAAVDRAVAAWPSGRLIIGVHVRHRDYRTHAGGAHFIPVERTVTALRDLAERLSAQRPFFVVFSDEPRAPSEFPGLEHALASGSAAEDLFTMARCHAIIGPVSSFNTWAGWFGGVPVMHLPSPDTRAMAEVHQDPAMRAMTSLDEFAHAIEKRARA